MRDVLIPYAGQPGSGYAVVARRDGGAWEVLGGTTSSEDDESVEVDATTKHESSQDDGTLSLAKRRRTSDAVPPDPKRARGDLALGSSSGDGYESSDGDQIAEAPGEILDTNTVSTCLKPTPDPLVSALLARQKTDSPSTWETAGDLFLPDDFRTRWCRCVNCAAKLSQYPYLLIEETTYEPPPDPDRGRSLEELGMAALATMPREKALDGVRAFQTMKDEVMSFLRPFATDGRVVSAQDITKFFEERTEELARKARNRGM
jgi:E3 ubiquitin-protein ligase UBR7